MWAATTDTNGIAGRGKATRTAIVAAAAEFFNSHGYHATSISEVAEAAGVSMRAIYHHFTGKDKLLGCPHEAFMDQLAGSYSSGYFDGLPGRLFLLDMDFLLYEVSAQRGDGQVSFQDEPLPASN